MLLVLQRFSFKTFAIVITRLNIQYQNFAPVHVIQEVMISDNKTEMSPHKCKQMVFSNHSWILITVIIAVDHASNYCTKTQNYKYIATNRVNTKHDFVVF